VIDLQDCKYILIKSGREIPRYKCTCDSCGCDRGYKDKGQGNRLCHKCANIIIAKKVHKGKVISKEVRNKMSVSAVLRYNDPNWIAQKDIPKKERTYKNWDTKEQKKIKHNIRSLLHQKLKRRGLTKDNKTFSSLGYSPDDLINHLENQFQDGMSWDNYGLYGWHIDHIKPDSWFNYKSTEDKEFKKSWALSNLQPLWAKDNLSKNNRYSEME